MHKIDSSQPSAKETRISLRIKPAQNQKKGMVRNYVTCRGTRVVGYYSLAYGSAAQVDAPPALTKGIGKYPIP